MKKSTDPWVTRNIKLYGNSVVPPALIEEYGINTTEKLISYAAGVRVKITERHPMIEKGNELWGYKTEKSKKPLFVAEVIENGRENP